MSAKKSKPKQRPLSCTVTREGVLRIEIGVEALAHAALRSPFAWQMTNERNPERADAVQPEALFQIRRPHGFAVDVARELLDEAGDGSSLLTALFDDATRKAIEQGSIFWIDGEDEP